MLGAGSPLCTMGGQEDGALVVKGGCWVLLLQRAPWMLNASQHSENNLPYSAVLLGG